MPYVFGFFAVLIIGGIITILFNPLFWIIMVVLTPILLAFGWVMGWGPGFTLMAVIMQPQAEVHKQFGDPFSCTAVGSTVVCDYSDADVKFADDKAVHIDYSGNLASTAKPFEQTEDFYRYVLQTYLQVNEDSYSFYRIKYG